MPSNSRSVPGSTGTTWSRRSRAHRADDAHGLRQVLGRRAGDLDLSFYEQAGRERAGIYSTDRVQKAYGWRAWVDPAAMVRTGVPAADGS